MVGRSICNPWCAVRTGSITGYLCCICCCSINPHSKHKSQCRCWCMSGSTSFKQQSSSVGPNQCPCPVCSHKEMGWQNSCAPPCLSACLSLKRITVVCLSLKRLLPPSTARRWARQAAVKIFTGTFSVGVCTPTALHQPLKINTATVNATLRQVRVRACLCVCMRS